MPEPAENSQSLSLLRNLKIGTFHIGSAMADVIGQGVWNRVMIQELGYAATPIGLLLALRYFLAPLAIWAGGRSDYTHLRGYRRLPWIWGGRLGMALGYVLVAFSTVQLVQHGAVWWFGILAGFVLVSVGSNISGSTFLALVYDRAPSAQRGRAVGIVWTFLLAGYAIAGVLFAGLLPEYSPSAFLSFFLIVSTILVFIWVFALWGEERPYAVQTSSVNAAPPFMADLRGIIANRSARTLMLFMVISFMAAFMQDTLLEPFGGKVFALSVGETTRFQAYWGTMAILSSGFALWLHRRYSYQWLTKWGVGLLILTFLLLAFTALSQQQAILRPSLLLLGLGYGLWNIGTLGLMVEYSRQSKIGLDLGVWTVVATLCRGGGVFVGAALFDLLAAGFGDKATAYGSIFLLEAVLLVMGLAILSKLSARAAPVQAAVVENELVLSTMAE